MTTNYDEKKAGDFVGRVLTDTGAATTTALAALGDSLGLFKALASEGPATSFELAQRTKTSERHVREWLAAMFAAGYLDRSDGRYVLPDEYAPVLAQERGPVFFGGIHQCVMGYLAPFERIVDSFRTGGGVPQSAYPERMYEGMERFTGSWFENLLLPVWVPAAGLETKLKRGIEVADIGCGRGRALVKLAQEYKSSQFVGYDLHAPNIEKARKNAEEAGVADRVRFVELDAIKGLPDSYDLVTTFDVVHDASDPDGLLRSIRRSLRKGGDYLCLEINCSARPDENKGPLGTLFYGCSILYCMNVSLAHGGAGLGTCGVSEPVLREMAMKAEFSGIKRLELENPFNVLYLLAA
jgi:ubiquinone/menaquinone biosynthesis C-methylase UbiE